MKLYLFQCGTIKTFKHLLVKDAGIGQPYEVPVPFFLITHPDGIVLFDTGQPLAAATASHGQDGNYLPVMTPDDYVIAQLARIGMRPSDITRIVISHRHADHAGGLEAFRDAACYLQKEELTYDDGQNFISQYPLRWQLLNGDHDIFGDGKIKIIFTPGHTPGHQSLLVKLEKRGDILLTSDSVYTEEILEKGILPGVFFNQDDTVKTINMIKAMRRDGIRIITGHDPQAWSSFKLAPKFM